MTLALAIASPMLGPMAASLDAERAHQLERYARRWWGMKQYITRRSFSSVAELLRLAWISMRQVGFATLVFACAGTALALEGKETADKAICLLVGLPSCRPSTGMGLTAYTS